MDSPSSVIAGIHEGTLVIAQQRRSLIVADIVYTGLADDIDALVASYQFSPEAYVLMEQYPEHTVTGTKERQNLLLFLHLSELGSDPYQDIHLDSYMSGRVFDQHAEIRWERVTQEKQQKGKFQVVFIGPEHMQFHLPTRDHEGERLGKSRNRRYFLFGERLDANDINAIGPHAQEGDFAQLRIPRLLRYPSPLDGQRARRLRLEVSEYVDEDTGKVRLFRFRDLQTGE